MIQNEYFNWLQNLTCASRGPRETSYRRLLIHLHNTEFTYSIFRDQNRAEDGIDLRWRFARERYFDPDYYEIMAELDGPCTVLEMMVALSIRCEENIMDDPHIGDRTAQWFWGMINNLGLGSITDDQYDKRYVDSVIDGLLHRTYEPDGRGGLFRIRNCDRDLRSVEIWHQLCWYLDSIT